MASPENRNHTEEDYLHIQEVNQYLEELGQRLLDNDYKDENGSKEACGAIANDVARLLLRNGVEPRIDELRPIPSSSDRFSHPELFPLPFQGRVGWAWHTICVVGDIVFDPVAKRPLPFDQYREELFGVPVAREVSWPTEELKEFIKDTWGA